MIRRSGLRFGEVPGSIPGQALFVTFLFLRIGFLLLACIRELFTCCYLDDCLLPDLALLPVMSNLDRTGLFANLQSCFCTIKGPLVAFDLLHGTFNYILILLPLVK